MVASVSSIRRYLNVFVYLAHIFSVNRCESESLSYKLFSVHVRYACFVPKTRTNMGRIKSICMYMLLKLSPAH